MTLMLGVPAWAVSDVVASLAETDDGDSHSLGDKILNLVINPEPPTLVSFANTSGTSVVTSSKVLEGLLHYDAALQPRPQLATSWTISEDGLSYRFQLREGVRWHDGAPFTADDVVFSINTVKRYHPRGSATFAHVIGVEAEGRHGVVIRLAKPAPYLILAFAGGETPMLPSHLYRDGDLLTHSLNHAPVGTGPFIFKHWERGSHILYERNPHYWGEELPHIDRLVFRIVPDVAARMNAFQSGELDLGPGNPIPLSEIQHLHRYPHLAVTTEGYQDNPVVSMLEFNLDHPILANLKVRQAIAHAIDREVIKRVVHYGYADVSVGPIAATSFPRYRHEGKDPYPHDPERANQLLDEAGHVAKGGKRFSLTLDFNPFDDSFQRTAVYLRSALSRLGIGVELRAQDPASYIRRVYAERDFDFTVSGVSTMFDPTVGLQRIYWSKSFQPGVPFSNANHYRNPRVDELLEAAAVETDDERRAGQFKAFQDIVVRDIPSIALVVLHQTTVYHTRVHGFNDSASGVRHTLANVDLAPSGRQRESGA
ncbi:ABC transporter substrate-binding protein [Zobellella iuensis]|uniref:ABC transporter substrate-binding protein n=1 Tax=Zobellella iuensis TaxID=2803811 RepID=A0ABS1QN79_9GAMM|nr:ABC transporter substrate-binding protein [Zobellella iuensis]MBL1376317.1 ABC transporter substrate-binding protein [Zobellella iuensis]